MKSNLNVRVNQNTIPKTGLGVFVAKKPIKEKTILPYKKETNAWFVKGRGMPFGSE